MGTQYKENCDAVLDMKKENASALFGLLAERTAQVVFVYYLEAQEISYINPAFEQVWQHKRERFYKNPSARIDTIHLDDKAYIVQSFEDIILGKVCQS